MVLVTRQAPDFTAAAVLGNGEIVENFNFKEFTKGKPAVVFFWPMDFTFVCPSELIAFDHRYKEFKSRGVEVVGVSMDSEFVHNAWRKTLSTMAASVKFSTHWLLTSNTKSCRHTALNTQKLALLCVVLS